MKSFYLQIDEIKKDLKNIKKTFETEMSQQIEKDLIKAHDIIISNFYNSYTPTSYHRHGIGGLYNSIAQHKNIGNGAFIVINNSNMEEHYRISSEVVLDLMWDKGIRGLPYIGQKNLSHDYIDKFSGTHFKEGEKWKNPFWSGDSDPYHNIFMPSLKFGNYKTYRGTPHDIMEDFVNNWDKAYGKSHCKKIERMII